MTPIMRHTPAGRSTVISALHHEIEVADDAATMYLSGVLTPGDAFSLSQVCIGLPERVHTLRLDLHGLAMVEDDALQAIRGVLRYWRESRGGSFRLSFATERIVATYGEGRFAGAVIRRRPPTARVPDRPAIRVATVRTTSP